jgi:hypothetical protein
MITHGVILYGTEHCAASRCVILYHALRPGQIRDKCRYTPPKLTMGADGDMTGLAAAISTAEGINKVVALTRTIADLVKKGATLELQERITDLREAVQDAKDEVLALREENRELRGKMAEQEAWDARASKYTLVTTAGGAHVYRTGGPPEHYACPKCFEDRKIHILQDKRLLSGTFVCPSCSSEFPVNPRTSLPPLMVR